MNYFLYGADQGRLRQKVNEIYLELNQDQDCDFISYNLQKDPFQEVMQEAFTPSFFASKKLIVAYHANFLSGSEKEGDMKQLEQFLTRPILENTLILVGDFDKPDGRKKIVKLVQSTCKTYSLGIFNEQEKRNYIYSKIRELHLELSETLKNNLVERLPMDQAMIDLQLEKCALYPEPLDLDTVSLLLPHEPQEDIFAMIEAILKGKSKKAFQIYQDMIALNYDPIYLIAVMASSIRFYYQVKVLANQGYSEERIAKELKAHPYRVKLTLQNVSYLSLDTLMDLLAELAQCDQKIKKGLLPKNLVFELFLIYSQGVIK